MPYTPATDKNRQRDDRKKENGRSKGTDRGISDSDNRKLKSLKLLLSEQAETLDHRREEVNGEKQAAEERVKDTFRKLHEILATKEHDLIVRINARYSVFIDLLSQFGSCVDIDNRKIFELLTSCRESTGDNMEKLKIEIELNAQLRNSLLNQFYMPHLVLEERAIQTMKDLSFAELETAPSPSAHTATDQTQLVNIEHGTQAQEGGELNETEVCANLNAVGFSESQEQNRAEESSEDSATGVSMQLVTTGASGHPDTAGLHFPANIAGAFRQPPTPSAPPMNSTDAPPPYWEAVGLERPEADRNDNKNIKVPKNKLELVSCFNVLKKHGLRTPVPVGLTWNCGKICIVDRANRRVEFFSPNGQIISGMFFDGVQLRDITFFYEAHYEGYRYVLNSSKDKTLYIIGFDGNEILRLFQKLHTDQQYSCICRGTIFQSLIGAEVSMTTGFPCVVNMFSLTGQILLSIAHTPNNSLWQYIRSVDVFGSTIIILDWKINLVAMFRDDGSAVGEYHGTEQSPLINPSDMTLDQHGNVFILNGEFQNVHLIDLQCHPLEIIRIPKDISPSSARLSLIAFDLESHRLCIAKSNGDTAIFTFANGYNSSPYGEFSQRLLLSHQNTTK